MNNPTTEKAGVSRPGTFVGVIPPSAFGTVCYPKRLLLMFDSLALDTGQGGLKSIHQLLTAKDGDFRWLRDEGIVTTVSGLIGDGILGQGRVRTTPVEVVGGDLLGPVFGKHVDVVGRAAHLASTVQVALRHAAAKLRTLHGIDAVAIPSVATPQDVDSKANRDTVIRLTLTEFPSPSDDSSWRDIIEFRRDPQAKAQFARLKAWINKTAKLQLTQFEVHDELHQLIAQFEAHIRSHQMRPQPGVIEVVVTTTAEVADDLVKIHWPGADKSGFRIQRDKIRLLDEEKSSIGREVEYILSAHSRFP
jgi:hypothetical protein